MVARNRDLGALMIVVGVIVSNFNLGERKIVLFTGTTRVSPAFNAVLAGSSADAPSDSM